MLIREGRGYRNRGGTIKWWYSLETGSWFLLKKKKKKMHNNVFEFYRTGAPTQVEDGNFRLNTRFLEHRSVASPPANQKKVTHPAALTPKVAFCFSGSVMTILLGLLFGLYFISERSQQFQAKLLLQFTRVNAGFRQRIPRLRSGRERFLLC